jgi:hypothetical protein
VTVSIVTKSPELTSIGGGSDLLKEPQCTSTQQRTAQERAA